jgi:hypothetical protein
MIMLTTAAAAAASNKLFQIINLLSNIQIHMVFFFLTWARTDNYMQQSALGEKNSHFPI